MQSRKKNSCGLDPKSTFNDARTIASNAPPTSLIDPKIISLSDLNINTNDIATYQNERISTFPDRENARARIERQLMNSGKCSTMHPGLYNEISYNLFRLSPKMIEKTLHDTEYNQLDVHKTLSCAVDTIIYDNSYMADRFHTWFSDFKVIGAPSAQGVAVKSKFPGKRGNELFILKTPINPSERGLYHEAVVGFYGLNPLKQLIPNFMYIYGITDCSAPVIDTKEMNRVESFCARSDGTKKTPYLISENISDSWTFGNFVQTTLATKEIVGNLIMQIMNALYVANRFCDYTHYDLHAANVMIYKLENKVAIPLYVDNTLNPPKMLIIEYVAVIIDYGFSHVNVGGVGLGEFGLERLHIDPQKSFPLYDIYKLVMFLAQTLQENPIRNERVSNVWTLFDTMIKTIFNKNMDQLVNERISLGDKGGFYHLDENFRRETMFDAYSKIKKLFTNDSRIYIDANSATMAGYNKYSDKDETYCDIIDAMSDTDHNTTLSQLNQALDNIAMSTLRPTIKNQKADDILGDVDVIHRGELELYNIEYYIKERIESFDLIDKTVSATYSIANSNTTLLKIQTPNFYNLYEQYIRTVVRADAILRLQIGIMANIKNIIQISLNMEHKRNVDKIHEPKQTPKTETWSEQFVRLYTQYFGGVAKPDYVTKKEKLTLLNKRYLELQEKMGSLGARVASKKSNILLDDDYIQHKFGYNFNQHADATYTQKWMMIHDISDTLR